ncbi:MAG: rhodanese-like domain-containing protein [Pseudomonadota bacterium]
MSVSDTSVVDALTPQETWDQLSTLTSSALVDVRTRAEWAFVGVPDVTSLNVPFLPVEWTSFPSMAPNTAFVDQMIDAAGGELPERVFFICRSGARSMMAAQTVAGAMQSAGQPVHCTNVSEGFEGDLDAEGHRGKLNGWKAHGLPWRQS